MPEQDIDDLVNDALEKVVRNATQFRGAGPFDHWAVVVFSRVCSDYFRRVARRRSIELLGCGGLGVKEGNGVPIYEGSNAIPDASEIINGRRNLDRLRAVLDQVIAETARLRQHRERDTEIARLALRDLLEPAEILAALGERFSNLTVNAIRIVVHEFRASLKRALEDNS